MQELRSQLQTEKSRGEEIWEELEDSEKACENLRSELKAAQTKNSELEQKLAAARKLPDAATILSQLRTRRKKSKTDLGDVETLLEILEPDTD